MRWASGKGPKPRRQTLMTTMAHHSFVFHSIHIFFFFLFMFSTPFLFSLSYTHTGAHFFPLIWGRAYEIHFRILSVKTVERRKKKQKAHVDSLSLNIRHLFIHRISNWNPLWLWEKLKKIIQTTNIAWIISKKRHIKYIFNILFFPARKMHYHIYLKFFFVRFFFNIKTLLMYRTYLLYYFVLKVLVQIH